MRFYVLGLAILAGLLAAPFVGYAQAPSPADSIRLNDGRLMQGTVRLFMPTQAEPYVLFNDSARYALGEVRHFGTPRGVFATRQRTRNGNRRETLVHETLLLKRTVAGPIDIYSEASWAMANPDNVRHDFFAVDGSALYPFEYKHLRQALADNAKSMEMLDRSQRLKRLGAGLLLAGSAVTIYGVSESLRGTPDPPISVVLPGSSRQSSGARPGTFIAAGLGVALSAAIPLLMRRGLLQRAVAVYNEPAGQP